MNNDKMIRMKHLIDELNHYRNSYYNYDTSVVSDSEYDALFDELKSLEHDLQCVLTNSPTISVGYQIIDKFQKITHEIPLLSLDKTKSIDEINKFKNNHNLIAMLKLDGITGCLTYDNGKLISVGTRGNGYIGENITHNASSINGIPLTINKSGKVIISGEFIVLKDDFDKVNNNLKEGEKKYKLQRSLASGSVRQLNSKICAERNIRFIAYNVLKINENIDTKEKEIKILNELGFNVVYCNKIISIQDNIAINNIINHLKSYADKNGIPIDGIVFTYNNKEYGKSLGETSHHPNHSIAFKFEDEKNITKFKGVELNPTRTGMVSITGLFETIDINGSDISRASLHNVDIFESLRLGIDDEINVIKANDIIPQIVENLTKSNTYKLSMICPCCGSKLEIKAPKDARFLYCPNDNCTAKHIAKFVHFVSKEGMNIDGLSEATLNKFINCGIIKRFEDIYDKQNWYNNKETIILMDGFGDKSYKNLIDSIDKSREVSLDNFICALGIPLIGKSASKTIAKKCDYKFVEFIKLIGTNFNWENLVDFGDIMANSINTYFDDIENYKRVLKLSKQLKFINGNIKSNVLKDKIFVITGTLPTLSREQAKKLIEENGGSYKTSVSKKTNYLLAGENCGSKLDKAKEVGTNIINEEEFLKMIK